MSNYLQTPPPLLKVSPKFIIRFFVTQTYPKFVLSSSYLK